MANIDDKVVAMSFEGRKFEAGVQTTLSALDKLKRALTFSGAGKGLDEINKASKRVDFSHMSSSLNDISNKLGALRLTAIATFSQIAMRAISAGTQFAKSFTTDPIKAGLAEYTTNLNAVQTILANTQAAGTGLKDVNAALLELNKYSDKTIYNFAQMARNIGTFTAAGVDLKTSTASIKGIANLAALSGSNAEQAATAMYQLSQAISSGRVSLMDWNSVVNAGMGGTVFQRALAQTAEAMGTLKDGAVKLEGPMKNVKINGESFRESIGGPGPKWLTSDVLTNTLKQFTSDMSVAELKAQGFNDAQIKAIQQTAKTAMQAATQVKTLSQTLDVAKETAQSGWAQTWQIIFGDFGEAKTLFTGLSNAINGFINTSANARNKVLGDWKKLGGRTVLIEGIKTMFQSLGAILQPIKEAFRDIFPAKTGKDLYNLTVQFKAFAEAMKPSPETIENIRRTFRGLFAVLDIGKQIVNGIFTVFRMLFHALGGGNGSFLEFTGSIGDFLVKVDKALKKGNALQLFFVELGTILSVPVKLLKALAEAIANLFSGFSPGGFSDEMASLTVSAKPFERAVKNIGEALQGLGPAISNAISNINWETILQVVRTGLFAALILMIRKFIGGTNLKQIFGIMGKNVGKSFGAGILGNVGKAFGGLSGTLKTMQTELKARTLKEIAIAIALLAASVLALSLVKPEKLNSAMSAMTILFGELIAAMAIIDKLTKTGTVAKLPFIAASLILLSVAINLLTLSVLALSRLSWDELSKGLIGVGVLLGGLSAASTVLSKNAAGMIRSGIGIMAIAVAMKILASAMKDFGALSWTELAKGLVGVAGGLTAIAASMQLMPKNMLLRSAAIIAIAAALNLIADAMAKFGAMNWSQIGKGMAGVAGSLIIIAGAMHLMPKNMVITAAGLLLVAASLDRIQSAVAKMGGMSIKELAKGLIGLGGALGVLAIGLHAMAGTVTGAIALGIAATGLSLLAKSLVVLGRQSWGTLLKGLIGLAATIGIIAGASLLLSTSIPALLGFGAALVLIGGGLALAGAGVALIGVGLSAIAVSGSAAVGILIKALTDLVAALVKIADDLVLGLLEIVKTFAATAPAFTKALVVIISNLLDVIILSAPKIGKAFEALLIAGLTVINNNADKVVQAGINLLMALLRGLRANIGQLVTTAVDIIVNFLNAISRNLGRIVTAGAQILVSLLKGIANNVGKIIAAGAEIIVQLVAGISKGASRVVTAGTNAVISFIEGVGKNAIRLARAAAQVLLDFINGLTQAINEYAPQLQTASLKLGYAIINGMTFGLAGKAQDLYNKAKEIGQKTLDLIKHPWNALSPSKTMIELGENIVQGLTNGLNANTSGVYSAASALSNGIIGVFNRIFQTNSPSKVMYEIGKYVGEGFAQGLRGTAQDIGTVWKDLNTQLTEAMTTARETIATEQAKLNELRKAHKPDAEAIKAAQKTIAENQSILERSAAAHTLLIGKLKIQRTELAGLARDYDIVSTQLERAQDVLANAVQTRDSAIQQYKDQYSTLPDIVTTDPEGAAIDQLAAYQDALKNQISAVGAYKSTLDQLRKLGLDDATYQKLLSEGTADQQFATQLLSGGKTAVQSLNTLDAQLLKVSRKLAVNAGKNLYQAGVDAAEGLVKGLESKKTRIHQAIEAIARDILETLRKELKVKSPSQVFAEIGGYAMEGLAQGFLNSSGTVRSAIESSMEEAKDALRRSVANMSSLVAGELNLNPVITPVLDLSKVKTESRKLASLTSLESYAQASAISTRQIERDPSAVPMGLGASIKFEQNNFSPESLSEVEIYRQTRNQLSQLKSILAV